MNAAQHLLCWNKAVKGGTRITLGQQEQLAVALAALPNEAVNKRRSIFAEEKKDVAKPRNPC